jgi:hypothetical protein
MCSNRTHKTAQSPYWASGPIKTKVSDFHAVAAVEIGVAAVAAAAVVAFSTVVSAGAKEAMEGAA